MKLKKATIVSFSGIGDAMLTEVLCENLKVLYPGIIVDMVVKDNSFPLFIKNKNIDNVIPYYKHLQNDFLQLILTNLIKNKNIKV